MRRRLGHLLAVGIKENAQGVRGISQKYAVASLKWLPLQMMMLAGSTALDKKENRVHTGTGTDMLRDIYLISKFPHRMFISNNRTFAMETPDIQNFFRAGVQLGHKWKCLEAMPSCAQE